MQGYRGSRMCKQTCPLQEHLLQYCALMQSRVIALVVMTRAEGKQFSCLQPTNLNHRHVLHYIPAAANSMRIHKHTLLIYHWESF